MVGEKLTKPKMKEFIVAAKENPPKELTDNNCAIFHNGDFITLKCPEAYMDASFTVSYEEHYTASKNLFGAGGQDVGHANAENWTGQKFPTSKKDTFVLKTGEDKKIELKEGTYQISLTQGAVWTAGTGVPPSVVHDENIFITLDEVTYLDGTKDTPNNQPLLPSWSADTWAWIQKNQWTLLGFGILGVVLIVALAGVPIYLKMQQPPAPVSAPPVTVVAVTK